MCTLSESIETGAFIRSCRTWSKKIKTEGDYMKNTFRVTVISDQGKRVVFENLEYGTNGEYSVEGVQLNISSEKIIKIQFTLAVGKITSIEYDFRLNMQNYYSAILPESGRWFFNSLRMVTFWRDFRKFESGINDTKMPLLILTGNDMFTSAAVGIIGENYETQFNLLEPESNRALNVHTGHITYQVKRGTSHYPIPSRISEEKTITEYIYIAETAEEQQTPWVLTMREFSEYQRELFSLKDITVKDTMYPLWCTWADWHSNDINDRMILENVEFGLSNGIKNYIIDDGWFGPGLDNNYSVPLNIGDWEPDPTKIPDMKNLVDSIHEKGAKAIIWCAPHAVAKGAKCYHQRKKYLIADREGEPYLNPTQFYSLCFMCKEAREIMADICAEFIVKWGVDGAKYDLFNWVPNVKCENPNHEHDVDSMMDGLNKTFELIEERTRALKENYIVEMKQNYGTPFLSRWGTMMRAGDSPYDGESNFLRTMHVQSYTPFSLNDYQTFTEYDTPRDIAISIIKMLAAGIPAYSVNFKRLTDKQNMVINYLNTWYCNNIDSFMNYRIPCDANNYLLKLANGSSNIYFMINENVMIKDIKCGDMVFNASYHQLITIKTDKKRFQVCGFDCYGHLVTEYITDSSRVWETVSIFPGGHITIQEI